LKVLLADGRAHPAAAEGAALRYAAACGHVDAVQALLADPRVDPADFANAAIRRAARAGHVPVVRALLSDRRVNPRAVRHDALQNAALLGHADVFRLLLDDARVDPAADNDALVAAATCGGNVEVVRAVLLDPRMDVGAAAREALLAAVRGNHAEVVAMLLADARVCVHLDSFVRMLNEGVTYDHGGVVQVLLQHTAWEPPGACLAANLLTAVYYGCTAALSVLLCDARVDPSASGNSAVWVACDRGHSNVAKQLVADPRVEVGSPLLGFAACRNKATHDVVSAAYRWRRRRPWLRACGNEC
jgi:hypothetical protein